MSSKTARAASALKSGVVMGGTAILSAVNGLTPHMAGAIDIMVVQQPDGSLKCSPFYVRFGKYTPMRSKDKRVQILINGEEAAFSMHLGAYGQAYFAAETMEIVSDAEEEELLQGMMSPPSGYSSADEDAPYANAAILSAVQQEVQRLKGAAEPQQAQQQTQQVEQLHQAARLEQQQQVERLERLPSGAAGDAELSDSGSESDSSSSSSSSSLGDVDVAAAIRTGLAAGSSGGRPAAAAAADGGSGKQRRRRHRARRLLNAPGDGAAEDPARKTLQDMLLDNKYSIRLRSDSSFGGDSLTATTAAAALARRQQQLQAQAQQQQQGQQQQQQGQQQGQQQQKLHGKSRMQQQQQPQVAEGLQAQQGQQQQQQQCQQKQQQQPARHVGFKVASPSAQAAAAAAGAGAATGSAGPAFMRQLRATDVAVAMDPAASYSVDEVSVAGSSSFASLAAAAADDTGADADDEADTAASGGGASRAAAAAAAAAAAPIDIESMPTLTETLQVLPVSNGLQQQQQAQSSPGSSRARGGLLSSSLEAAAAAEQQQAAQQQQQAQGQQAQAQQEQAALVPRCSDSSGVSSSSGSAASAAGNRDADGAAADDAVPPSQSPVAGSRPVGVPRAGALPAASPPAGGGSLADAVAAGAGSSSVLGTSFEPPGTPRSRAAAEAAAAAAAASPLAALLGPGGLALSMCGDQLSADMAPAEAAAAFEAGRLNAAAWAQRGVSLLGDPQLVVRVGGSLYSWEVAAPMVVGMLAFGGKWDSLLGLDATGLYPIKVPDDSSAAKKSSSWRLWPFTSWREPGGATPSGTSLPGTSPQPQPRALSASAAAGALQPAGGSFGNLRALVAPGGAGARSAPDRTGYSADAGAAAQMQLLEGEQAALPPGGSPRAGGRTVSFASSAGSPSRASRKKHIIIIRKTLTPTSEQLSRLPLRPGANTITFRAAGAAELTAYIYLLRWNTRLVVSDVDGTITRSDLLGHVLPTLGVDWSHPGITQLFHNIAANGYQIMFLSSRAIAQANITREYLHRLVQDGYQMPSGPVIISPHGLLPSLYREIVVRRPHEFKIACLQDIRALFPPDWNPFYAGFGNRDTDEVSYKEVGVPLSRTFTINPKGQIQKAATAVQSSTWSSLSAINELVHEIFPPMAAPGAFGSSSSISGSSYGGGAGGSFNGLLLGAGAAGGGGGAAGAAAGGGGGNASASGFRGTSSSWRASDDWGSIAVAGGLDAATVAAAEAERERRRSSSSGGPLPVQQQPGGDAQQAAAEPAATAAAAMAAANGKLGSGGAGGASQPLTVSVVASGSSRVTLDITSSGGGTSGGGVALAALLGPAAAGAAAVEEVAPSREEFNDMQFWRPCLAVDVADELAKLQQAATGAPAGTAWTQAPQASQAPRRL